MSYSIHYFSIEVQRQIAALPSSLRARYIAVSARMLMYGPHLGEPHTKALGNGLFELRLKASDGIARALYCLEVEQRIVVLHVFIKKSTKLPLKDIRLAASRMKEVRNAIS